MSKLQDTLDNALDELKEWAADNPGYDPDEMISELADSAVPVYTYDLLQMAMDNFELAIVTPDLATDGMTPTDMIGLNIYEMVESKLWAEWESIKEEIEEESKPKINPDTTYVFEITPYIVTEERIHHFTKTSITIPAGMTWQCWAPAEEIEDHEDNLIMRTPDFWNMFNQIVEFAAEVGLEHISIMWSVDDRDIEDMKRLQFNQKMQQEASHQGKESA